MEEYSIKGHFMDRLYGEYQAYKASVLCCPNAEIFDRCYEIDVMVNFYEILAEKADTMTEQVLAELMRHKNILTELYELWLKKDDSSYSEMEKHVCDEIETMTGEAEQWKEM